MNSTDIKRGLFVKRKLSSKEAWSLDDYLESAKALSASILRENDIDPDSLFDWLEVEVIDEIARTRFEGKFLKWTVLQRDSLSAEQLEAIDQIYHYKTLSAEAHQAITVILQWHTVQRDLANPQEKAALCNGIRFATAIEHLKANIAWWPTVRKKIKQILATIANNEKRRKETKQTAEDDWQPRCDELFRNNLNRSWHDIAIDVGSKFGQSYSTIKRHCKDPTKA